MSKNKTQNKDATFKRLTDLDVGKYDRKTDE